MSEVDKNQAGKSETFARFHHGIRRFTGRSILTYEQRKQYDEMNSPHNDPLGGMLSSGSGWEERMAEMEAEADRLLLSRAVRSAARGLVEWWPADNPITDGDINLTVSEREFLEGLENPGLSPQEQADIEASMEDFRNAGLVAPGSDS